MKKVLKGCSALMLALVLVLASGCNPNYRPEFEYGDFICREWIEGKIYITDLSEQGKQKRVLIVPEEVNGKPVVTIRNPAKWGGTEWKSDNLEKLYLPWNMSVDEVTTLYCENLKAVFVISFKEKRGIYLYPTNIYYSRYVYMSMLEKGWNLDYERPANIAYYYNDGRTENYGCYWLDNVPYGSLLDVLPPENPVSKGKRFAGWFKEPECINAWDFEKDTTPAEKLDEDGNIIYQETALYAKWI